MQTIFLHVYLFTTLDAFFLFYSLPRFLLRGFVLLNNENMVKFSIHNKTLNLETSNIGDAETPHGLETGKYLKIRKPQTHTSCANLTHERSTLHSLLCFKSFQLLIFCEQKKNQLSIMFGDLGS